ncbi:hypothetical protein PVK06_023978 [Gossypium arboreum]|uniref:DUF8040 domain-containing protein n=1 Tax=Gossypium arboreum TaxID=29729 RepID=A0ABR0PCK0_GOSAR|nr:hypothetical protein PVK06_023978 [Gossypium arboreum]
MWVDKVLNGHDDRCMNSFRMPKNIFHSLLHDLQTNYGLKHGEVSAMEKLALSLYILGNRESNSNATERFQRSRETVSRIFTDMLDIFARMGIDTIKLTEGQFEEILNHIRHDTRYWPHFKENIILWVQDIHKWQLCLNPNTHSTIVSNLTATVSNLTATVTNLTATAVFNLTRGDWWARWTKTSFLSKFVPLTKAVSQYSKVNIVTPREVSSLGVSFEGWIS